MFSHMMAFTAGLVFVAIVVGWVVVLSVWSFMWGWFRDCQVGIREHGLGLDWDFSFDFGLGSFFAYLLADKKIESRLI